MMEMNEEKGRKLLEKLFDISGKRAIVTGASRGLGKGIAKGLHDAGADIVVMGTNEKVTQTARELAGEKSNVWPVVSDFSDQSSVNRAFEKAMSFLGGIDILVNNAGMQIRHKCEEFPLEDWNQVLQVNLTSVFQLSQLAGRIMMTQGHGKIINIASLLSFQGGFTVPAYAAAKGGMAQLTKALSNEWAARGVNVNAIAPGYMATDNTAALRDDPVRSEQISVRIPAGRWGTPEDLVGPVLFLSSAASNYVHGSIILVDGGWMGR